MINLSGVVDGLETKNGKDITAIYVEWVDSSRIDGWVCASDIKNNTDLLCKSVGWFVANKKDRIVVGAHMGRDPLQFQGMIEIPKQAIVKIKKVKI